MKLRFLADERAGPMGGQKKEHEMARAETVLQNEVAQKSPL